MPASSLLRRFLPYLSVALAGALLYDGWIFYDRWSSRHDAEKARHDAEVQRARDDLKALGGTDFRIMNFYASPEAVHAGASAQLCYGVYGAKTVRLDPPVDTIAPAISHCLEVVPRKTTEYKLIAEDGAGHNTTASVTISVLH